MWHVERKGRREIHTVFSWGNPKVRDHLQDLGVNGTITLQRM
jgi:hypothetical protein